MPLTGDFLQRSRQGTTHYFRRRVPEDLRAIVVRRQLYRSLLTCSSRVVIAAARTCQRARGCYPKSDSCDRCIVFRLASQSRTRERGSLDEEPWG